MPAQKIRNIIGPNSRDLAGPDLIERKLRSIGCDKRISIDVCLRNVQSSDLDVFFEHQLEPDMNALANSQTRDRDVYFKHWKSVRNNSANIFKTIVANGKTAGYVLSWQSARRRMVGYWIGKEFLHKGVAQTATLLFLIECNIRPLFARVAKRNLASLAILRRCGFSMHAEGTFTNMYGEICEEFRMSLGANRNEPSFDTNEALLPLS